MRPVDGIGGRNALADGAGAGGRMRPGAGNSGWRRALGSRVAAERGLRARVRRGLLAEVCAGVVWGVGVRGGAGAQRASGCWNLVGGVRWCCGLRRSGASGLGFGGGLLSWVWADVVWCGERTRAGLRTWLSELRWRRAVVLRVAAGGGAGVSGLGFGGCLAWVGGGCGLVEGIWLSELWLAGRGGVAGAFGLGFGGCLRRRSPGVYSVGFGLGRGRLRVGGVATGDVGALLARAWAGVVGGWVRVRGTGGRRMSGCRNSVQRGCGGVAGCGGWRGPGFPGSGSAGVVVVGLGGRGLGWGAEAGRVAGLVVGTPLAGCGGVAGCGGARAFGLWFVAGWGMRGLGSGVGMVRGRARVGGCAWLQETLVGGPRRCCGDSGLGFGGCRRGRSPAFIRCGLVLGGGRLRVGGVANGGCFGARSGWDAGAGEGMSG